MGIDGLSFFVALLLGFVFLVAAIVAAVMRRRRTAGYLAIVSYVFTIHITLWFFVFGLIGRFPTGTGYILGATLQIIVTIIYLAICCFGRFRPLATAFLLVYMFSLLLQIFSNIYWSYGTAKNFSVSLSHFDSFYFALGTLTTAGTGNISAISETSRRIQGLQMGLDLIFIGIVLALIVARYSSLFARPQAALPRNTEAQQPMMAIRRSKKYQGSNESKRGRSNYPGNESESSEGVTKNVTDSNTNGGDAGEGQS